MGEECHQLHTGVEDLEIAESSIACIFDIVTWKVDSFREIIKEFTDDRPYPSTRECNLSGE